MLSVMEIRRIRKYLTQGKNICPWGQAGMGTVTTGPNLILVGTKFLYIKILILFNHIDI